MSNLYHNLLIVDIKAQILKFHNYIICKNKFNNNHIHINNELNQTFYRNFSISTATIGINNQINSYGTPIGKHVVCEKIGHKAEIFTIFKARKNTGKICTILNQNIDQDLILTRIIRLKGIEIGLNKGTDLSGTCVDSYRRKIYIHGTNREDLLGKPASNGCIRMNNKDIIELFNMIKVGDKVYIIGI